MRVLPVLLLALGLWVPGSIDAQTPRQGRPPAQTPARRPATGPGVLTGVVAAEDGAPLASATVAVRRMSDSTVVGGKITDRQGRFRVEGLPAGSYLVQVSAVGKSPATRRGVEVTAASPTSELGTIRLAAAAVQLQGVVARGQAPPMRMASDRTIYSLQDMPVAAGGVATDVLRTVPDIQVDVEGKITAMGSSPAVHLNGRPAPMQGEALTAFLQNLPADRIERIEYIPNPSAKYEAEGQGGILNIVLKENVSLGLSGTLSANTGTRGQNGGSARLNYQEGRLTFFGGGSFGLNRDRNENFDLRENRAADPVTYLEQDGSSRNERAYGGGDVTVEWKLSPRSTLWSGARGNYNGSESNGITNVLLMNSLRDVTSNRDRVTGNENSWASGFGSLGFRRVIQAQRDEFSTELRYARNGNSRESEEASYLRSLLDGELVDAPPALVVNSVDEREGNLSLQADLSRPWGEAGRVDLGYRGSVRDVENDQEIDREASLTRNAFEHREMFHSVYLTVDRKIGRAGVQLGVRAERADTRFTLPIGDESYENDYGSIFPSANLSYDLGGGKSTRFSYSKRLDRPYAYLLNPINGSTDPFNRFMGNPELKPQYTHSFSFETSWNGRLGSLRLAPFYRRTVDVWDQIREVDAAGVSTITFENLASMTSYGTGVSVSLRQLGPISGLVSAQGFRQERDGSNLGAGFSNSSLSWSANGNLSGRVSETFNLQLSGFFAPERKVPQGTISSMYYLTLGGRKQLMDNKVALTFSLIDPFGMYEYNLNTSDATHSQRSHSSFAMRRLTLGLSYNFGRPPQSARRQTGGEEMQQPAVDAGGMR